MIDGVSLVANCEEGFCGEALENGSVCEEAPALSEPEKRTKERS